VAVTDTPVERSAPGVREPRRSRYVLAVALLLGGLGLALGVSLGAAQAKSDQATGFPRVSVPGALTVHVDQPGTYFVYSEGTACLDYPNCHGQLYPVTVQVTGPTGNVEVEPTSGPTYMVGGTQGTGVARFDVTAGTYRVAASTGPYSQGLIAVGEGFPWWTQDWVAWLALVLLWAGGILVVVVPIVTYHRRTRALPPRASG